MHHTLLACSLSALALIGSISEPADGGQRVAGQRAGGERAADVTIVGAPVVVAARDVSAGLTRALDTLAALDPAHPVMADMDPQTLSLFGREDLIAAGNDNYTASRCAPLPGARDLFATIERQARATRIVIVNESHERSEHRGFIAELAARLRPLGYDTLAMETLTNNPANVPEEYGPPFIRQPTLPYLSDSDGYYLAEAGFGRLGRRAKALGYRLLPYEFNDFAATQAMPVEQQIAAREEAQANNLAAFVRAHPGAKLLVHVGYSHAAEVPQRDGRRWMAARLKAKTGINPLTISQTTCRGSGATTRLVALPAREAGGTFDLVVDHPDARFVHGRPRWRQRAGDRAVAIPPALRPAAGWRVIEARPVGEPTESVPMDRIAIRAQDDVALMLPPGRYTLRIIDPARAAAPPGTTTR